jgi:hypothetical protein
MHDNSQTTGRKVAELNAYREAVASTFKPLAVQPVTRLWVRSGKLFVGSSVRAVADNG